PGKEVAVTSAELSHNATPKGTSFEGYKKFKEKTMMAVNANGQKPSFSTQNIKLNKNDEITLTDTKGILEYYKVANNVDGLDIKQDGNKITIKAIKVGQEV